jgi:thiamine-phosphate pyrophosphorylase
VSTLPRLYLITDRRRIAGARLLDALDEAFRAGVRLAMLRELDLPAADLLEYAREAAGRAHRRGARLLVNDRVDVALAAGADGAHLRASSIPVAAARGLLGPERLLGASVHSPEEARRAVAEGADFVLFGPVYETPDKARFRPPQGLAALAAAARAARGPVFAVGGVTPERVAECLGAGAHGVAAIRGLLGGPTIGGRVREYARALAAAGRAPAAGARAARRGGRGPGRRSR